MLSSVQGHLEADTDSRAFAVTTPQSTLSQLAASKGYKVPFWGFPFWGWLCLPLATPKSSICNRVYVEEVTFVLWIVRCVCRGKVVSSQNRENVNTMVPI